MALNLQDKQAIVAEVMEVAKGAQAKPSQAKGVFIKKVSLSTTMGAGLAIDQSGLSATVN